MILAQQRAGNVRLVSAGVTVGMLVCYCGLLLGCGPAGHGVAGMSGLDSETAPLLRRQCTPPGKKRECLLAVVW